MIEPKRQAARAVALLEWLEKRPQGACKLEIPPGEFSDTSTVLRRFTERGQVGYVEEPGLKAGNPRRRYYVRALCPPGAFLLPLNIPRRAMLAADPNHKPRPRYKATPKLPNAGTVVRPKASKFEGEVIIPKDVKVTKAEHKSDSRYEVDKVEPFFAAGKWLRPTWSGYAR